jgi:hypothetical protein
LGDDDNGVMVMMIMTMMMMSMITMMMVMMMMMDIHSPRALWRHGLHVRSPRRQYQDAGAAVLDIIIIIVVNMTTNDTVDMISDHRHRRHHMTTTNLGRSRRASQGLHQRREAGVRLPPRALYAGAAGSGRNLGAMENHDEHRMPSS